MSLRKKNNTETVIALDTVERTPSNDENDLTTTITLSFDYFLRPDDKNVKNHWKYFQDNY